MQIQKIRNQLQDFATNYTSMTVILLLVSSISSHSSLLSTFLMNVSLICVSFLEVLDETIGHSKIFLFRGWIKVGFFFFLSSFIADHYFECY